MHILKASIIFRICQSFRHLNSKILNTSSINAIHHFNRKVFIIEDIDYEYNSKKHSHFFNIWYLVPLFLIGTYKTAQCETRSINPKNECNKQYIISVYYF